MGIFSRSKGFDLETISDPKKKSSVDSSEDGEKNENLSDAEEVGEDFDYAKMMEPKAQRRRRYFSLGVVSFTAFIFNLSFSIVLTSAKPYLDKMDPEAGTEFLGFFIAAQPLAQLIFSPIMGYLGNRLGSIRILSMISMTFLALGFTLYACVSAIEPPRKWYLFAARFLIGAAGGSITLCFSYIAQATTVKERTTAVSLFQMAQSSAFVVGPAIQAAFAPLGADDSQTQIGDSELYFNMYTGPSWLSVLLALINVLVFLPGIFTEYNIAKEEGDYLAKINKKKNKHNNVTAKLKEPDLVGLITCIIVFASVQFNFIFLESVATLLTMEMLGLTEERAIVIVGIFFASAGLYSGLIFSVMAPTSRKFGERVVMCAGIVLLLLGPVALFPYGSTPPPMKCEPNDTHLQPEGSSSLLREHTPLFFPELLIREGLHGALEWDTYNEEKNISQVCVETIEEPIEQTCYNCTETGCPIYEQLWCGELGAITQTQMIIGFALIVTGFPMGASMGNAIFSKILGPFPQGTWMGILGAGACAARVLCPICVTNLYAAFGTWAAFGFMTGVMIVVLIIFFIFYRKLVPYKYD